MSDQVDETRRWGLIIVTVVVSLVVIGVVGLGVSKARHPQSKSSQQAQASLSTQAPVKLYFESGSAALSAEAQSALSEVAGRARSSPAATVVVLGFVDATGDAEVNAALAKSRAQAVQHALEANGVEPLAISLSRPQVALGGTDPKEARRVEILMGP